jgi:hypothetical protein
MLSMSPGVTKIVTAVVSGALVVAAAYVPDVQLISDVVTARGALFSLAFGLGGWQLLRRHGDAPVTGVHVDDLRGQ